MPFVMRCECGAIASGDTEDELVLAVERHLAEEHPDLAGTVPPEVIIAMAEMI